MHIFSIIFLSTFFIYAKQDSLLIKSIDSLSIVDSINIILDEKTKLFTSYELRSFNPNDGEVQYFKKQHNKNIDSIFVSNDAIINKKIINQILNPYYDIPIGSQFSKVDEKIVKRYYFITDKPKYNFGLFDNNRLGAKFSLNPQFNSLFTSILGINNGDRFKIVGELKMHTENFLKNAESFDLYWKKTDSTSQIMKFGIFFPHPLSLDMGIDWKYHYEIFNAYYTKNENRVMLQVFTPYFYDFKIGFVRGQTKITNAGKNNNFEPLSYNAFSISINNDSRNDRLLPYKGKLIRAIIDGGLDRDIIYINTHTKMISFYNISDNVSIKFQWIMRGIYYHKYNIPKSRYLIFGGGSTLRGYQEQTFTSTQFQIYTIEFIYNEMSSFQTNTFIDLGSVNINPLMKHIIGFGLGIAQISESNIIKLEYALSNFNFKEGKIHLKWINRF